MNLEIQTELRPCYVDGKKALFHCWVQDDKHIFKINTVANRDFIDFVLREIDEKGVIPPKWDCIIKSKILAIVELENGEVKMVEPQKIRFADMKTYDYCFVDNIQKECE